MNPARRRLPSWALLLVWLVLAVGCARDSGPLWADPGVIRLAPDRVEVDVHIHNVSDTVRPVGEFALAGDDWDSLRFVAASLPRTIPAHDAVVVTLEVSPIAFRTTPNAYRSGHAILRFASDQHQFEVPIEFVGTDARGSGAPPWWLAIAGLTLLGLGFTLGSPQLRARLAKPSTTPIHQRLAIAGALASLLLIAAMIPWGNGVCLGRAGTRVGMAELDQCRAGLGGFEATMLPSPIGVWWWLIGITLAAGLLAVVRARARIEPAELALPLVRILGLAIALASLATGLVPSSAAAVDWVLAQLRPNTWIAESLGLPAWGLLAQPIACAGVVALIVVLPTRPNVDPIVRVLARLERLVWAAVVTTVFLGGWTIPGFSDRAVPTLPHAATIVTELLVLIVEIVAVDYGLGQLDQLLGRRGITARAQLHAHVRITIPLLLANLIAVTLWRVL